MLGFLGAVVASTCRGGQWDGQRTTTSHGWPGAVWGWPAATGVAGWAGCNGAGSAGLGWQSPCCGAGWWGGQLSLGAYSGSSSRMARSGTEQIRAAHYARGWLTSARCSCWSGSWPAGGALASMPSTAAARAGAQALLSSSLQCADAGVRAWHGAFQQVSSREQPTPGEAGFLSLRAAARQQEEQAATHRR